MIKLTLNLQLQLAFCKRIFWEMGSWGFCRSGGNFSNLESPVFHTQTQNPPRLRFLYRGINVSAIGILSSAGDSSSFVSKETWNV